MRWAFSADMKANCEVGCGYSPSIDIPKIDSRDSLDRKGESLGGGESGALFGRYHRSGSHYLLALEPKRPEEVELHLACEELIIRRQPTSCNRKKSFRGPHRKLMTGHAIGVDAICKARFEPGIETRVGRAVGFLRGVHAEGDIHEIVAPRILELGGSIGCKGPVRRLVVPPKCRPDPIGDLFGRVMEREEGQEISRLGI